MKCRLLQPILPFLALPLLSCTAFAQTTGVSRPDQSADSVATSPAGSSDHYVMPSHANAGHANAGDVTPVQATTQLSQPAYSEQSYPATGPAVSYPATAPAPSEVVAIPAPAPGSALIVRVAPAPAYSPTQTASTLPPMAPTDPDSGVVTAVPVRPFVLNAGTLLRVRLDQPLSTENTPVGTPFSAQLIADAGHSGEVLLPAGSTIHGRVAAVHGGSRLTGGASIRLQPQTVTLPDGTSYPLLASVSGVDNGDTARVNDEGVIQPRSNAKADVAAVGLATGTAAVTGAVIAGGVGAVVGAGIGAGVGTVVWLKQDHQETLPAGTSLYLSLDEPLQLTPRS